MGALQKCQNHALCCAVIAAACAVRPRTAIIIRSLNAVHHQDFMNDLAADGWQFLLMRQVYLSDSWAQIAPSTEQWLADGELTGAHDVELWAHTGEQH